MEKSTTLTRPRIRARRPVAALGKLTVAALLGLPLLFSSDLFVHGLTVPGLLFTGITLILAGILSGLIALGWRWAPLTGALLYGLLLAASFPTLVLALSHPSGIFLFAFNVVAFALIVVGMGAGVGATVQNYRRGADRLAPRWLAAGLTGLAGLTLGAILVATIAQADAGSAGGGVSPQVLATLPSVTTQDTAFAPAVLSAHVGETVAFRLDNRDASPHTFTIDNLHVDVFIPAGKSVLALFVPTKDGAYTFYCSLHPGMTGTLTVSP